jgi:hypothetical protein
MKIQIGFFLEPIFITLNVEESEVTYVDKKIKCKSSQHVKKIFKSNVHKS